MAAGRRRSSPTTRGARGLPRARPTILRPMSGATAPSIRGHSKTIRSACPRHASPAERRAPRGEGGGRRDSLRAIRPPPGGSRVLRRRRATSCFLHRTRPARGGPPEKQPAGRSERSPRAHARVSRRLRPIGHEQHPGGVAGRHLQVGLGLWSQVCGGRRITLEDGSAPSSGAPETRLVHGGCASTRSTRSRRATDPAPHAAERGYDATAPSSADGRPCPARPPSQNDGRSSTE